MTEKTNLTPDGTCGKCGSPDMMLATDQTQYTAFEYVDGDWMDGGTSYEALDNDDPEGNVRLFCTKCHEYHEVPAALL